MKTTHAQLHSSDRSRRPLQPILLLALLILALTLPMSSASAAGLEGRKTPKHTATSLGATLEGRRTPKQKAQSLGCQQYYEMGNINISWRECPSASYNASGTLYRSTMDGFGGWYYWGVYSHAQDGIWEYYIHRDGVYYAQNIQMAQFYVWNGRSWAPVEYSQIPW